MCVVDKKLNKLYAYKMIIIIIHQIINTQIYQQREHEKWPLSTAGKECGKGRNG